MEREHFEARLEGVSLNGIWNYRVQERWWGPSAFLLFVELGEAVFGVIGPCTRRSVAQWSEPKISLPAGAGLWDRYHKSSILSWSWVCCTFLFLLSLDIKNWEAVSSKKGNAEESSEMLSNLEIGDLPTGYCLWITQGRSHCVPFEVSPLHYSWKNNIGLILCKDFVPAKETQ